MKLNKLDVIADLQYRCRHKFKNTNAVLVRLSVKNILFFILFIGFA